MPISLRLTHEDIDWREGLLTIRNTKFGKTRLVPLHASTLQALAGYARQRDRFFAQMHRRAGSHFFVSRTGNRLNLANVEGVFALVTRIIGIRQPDAKRGPRLHDFRHRFAVETMQRWYDNGEPVDRRLPLLSTYLGHVQVTSTYWYLHATPKLMAAGAKRLERRWKGLQ